MPHRAVLGPVGRDFFGSVFGETIRQKIKKGAMAAKSAAAEFLPVLSSFGWTGFCRTSDFDHTSVGVRAARESDRRH